MNIQLITLSSLSLGLFLSHYMIAPVSAEQVVKGQSGSVFMEEMSTPPKGQVIREDSGSVFMEEVPSGKKKAAPQKAPPIDFSSLGVPVDPKGRIVPLIQPEAGPVLRNSSRIEVEYTPPAVYVPYYSPFMAPYSIPQSTPFGAIPRTVYSNPLYGYFPVPMGMPQYFSSSSDDAPGPLTYQDSGSYYNYPYVGGNFLNPLMGGAPWSGRGPSGGMFSPYGPSSPFTTVAPFGGSPFSYFPSFAGGPFGGMPYGAGMPYGIGMPYGMGMPFAGPGASVWSPRWRGPWGRPWGGGGVFIPQVTQYQQQGSITPIFPSKLDDD